MPQLDTKGSMMAKRTVTARVDPEIYKHLAYLAVKQYITVSAVVRQAIHQMLDRELGQ